MPSDTEKTQTTEDHLKAIASHLKEIATQQGVTLIDLEQGVRAAASGGCSACCSSHGGGSKAN